MLSIGWSLVRETFRHALDVLAITVPAWVLAHARPDWVERYQGRTDEVRLPKSKEAQLEFAETIGADGHMLLRPSIERVLRTGCGKCRRSTFCGVSGCRTTDLRKQASDGSCG